MTISKLTWNEIARKIKPSFPDSERDQMAYLLLNKIAGIEKRDLYQDISLDENQQALLNGYIHRVNQEEPIQYVLEEAYFYGRRFYVNSSVLIPRPETEELVRYLLQSTDRLSSVWDIGTGSGCIAVTISLEKSGAKVYASDVSENALGVAIKNNGQLGGEVTFFLHDVLNDEVPLDKVEIIVSNPPYIPLEEKSEIEPHVLREPHEALFCPPDQPMAFYEHIVAAGRKSLLPGGRIIVEVHHEKAREVAHVLLKNQFDQIQVYKDMQGKDRIVSGILPF